MKNKKVFSRRPTVGIVAFDFESRYSNEIFTPAIEFLNSKGINQIIFPGNSIFYLYGYEYQNAMIYNFVNDKNIDLVIVASGTIQMGMNEKEFMEFFSNMFSVPAVSLGVKLDGIPSVTIDNRSGMKEAVRHLIAVHGYRKIAFMRGPKSNHEANDRYLAYLEMLAEFNIPLDENLVVDGFFNPESGKLAAEELLSRDMDFDALVCANDDMALAALEVFKQRKIRVPEDIALVGFDDHEDDQFVIPALSTVRQPFEGIGTKAAEMAYAILSGEKVEDHIQLDTKMVVRHSCGCISKSVKLISQELYGDDKIVDKIKSHEINIANMKAYYPEIVAFIAGSVPEPLKAKFEIRLTELFDLFHKKINTTDFYQEFIQRLDTILNTDVVDGSIVYWQNIITLMNKIIDYLLVDELQKRNADLLFNKIRVLIGEKLQLEQAVKRNLFLRDTYQINGVISRIISTLFINDLMSIIQNELPTLDIPSCYICLFQEGASFRQGENQQLPETSELVMAYTEKGVIKLDPIRSTFPSFRMLPEGILPAGRNYTLVVKSLFFREDQIGYIIFEHTVHKDIVVYETLRLQISTALKGSLLFIEREKAEKKLLESNKKLQELDAAKTNFFANVSHELRTPLTLILGPLESILARDYKEEIGYNDEIFRSMLDNSLRLLKLINNLLDFTKIEAGKMQVNKRAVNVSGILKIYLSTIISAAKQKGIEIEYFDETRGLITFIDIDLFEKAFFNLISNALKFTDKGGKIRIRLSRLSLEGSENGLEPGNYFSLSIEDNGIGISEDKLDMIFERFSQVDSSSSRRYEGTGIGLALTKEVLEIQGGAVKVSSKLKEGSVFTMILPCIDAGKDDQIIHDISGNEKLYWFTEIKPEKTEETGDQGVIDLERPTLLIADDNEDMRKFLKFILDKEKYNVIGARNGKEALKLVGERNPDLVLSDVMMPEMDGYELTRAIKTNQEYAGIPVILLTAKSDVLMKIEGLEYGADDYISKPFNAKELLARIKSNLEMKKLRDNIAMQRDLLSKKKIDLESLVQEQTKTIESEKNLAVSFQKKAEKQLEDFLLVLASAIESKDHYTGGHVERVAKYTRDIAQKLNFNEHDIRNIFLGAIVHDVGKIGVRDSILNKSGKLNNEEQEKMRLHTIIGKSLLEKIENIDIATEIAYCHQERWDGKGYPRGLRGEEIPLVARIVTISDYWDAIITDRPYRKALTLNEAIKLMYNERGKAFDPELFDLFMNEKDKLYLKYVAIDKLAELADKRR